MGVLSNESPMIHSMTLALGTQIRLILSIRLSSACIFGKSNVVDRI